MERLAILLQIDVTDSNIPDEIRGLTISVSLDNIVGNIALFVALQQNKLDSLTLGSFLNLDNLLPCLLSAVDDMEITQIDLSFDLLDDPKAEGLMLDTDAIVTAFTRELMEVYRDQILTTFPKVFDTTLRNLLNGLLHTYIQGISCPLVTTFDDYIDFQNYLIPKRTHMGMCHHY